MQATDDTVQKIEIAAHDLLMSEGIDELRVNDICQKAGVSRQTFYNHFTSKYDVLNEYCMRGSYNDLFLVGKTLTWDEATRLSMSRIASEWDFYLRLLSSKDSYESYYAQSISQSIAAWRETIVDFNKETLTEELDFQIVFWSQAVASNVKHQFNGRGLDIDRVTVYFSHCRPQLLTRAMDDPVLKRRSISF